MLSSLIGRLYLEAEEVHGLVVDTLLPDYSRA
jgi:hypothetical protein